MPMLGARACPEGSLPIRCPPLMNDPTVSSSRPIPLLARGLRLLLSPILSASSATPRPNPCLRLLSSCHVLLSLSRLLLKRSCRKRGGLPERDERRRDQPPATSPRDAVVPVKIDNSAPTWQPRLRPSTPYRRARPACRSPLRGRHAHLLAPREALAGEAPSPHFLPAVMAFLERGGVTAKEGGVWSETISIR